MDSGAKETEAAEQARLRQERDDALAAKKKVELRNMELEDNLRVLTAPPAPAPAAEREPGWLDAYRDDV